MNKQPVPIITPILLKNKLIYMNQLILFYQLESPQITNNINHHVKIKINNYYQNARHTFTKHIHDTLVHSALSDYKYRSLNSYPITPYEANLHYQITYEHPKLISLYNEQYEYAGGAHGSTIRNSQTWDMDIGCQIPLQTFFSNDPNYHEHIQNYIIKMIAAQIQNDEKYYFNNYEELVKKTFSPYQFYLTEYGIIFYFQEYDIAPYTGGIPEFEIPYKN